MIKQLITLSVGWLCAHLSSHGVTCSWNISWALMISVFLRSLGLSSSITVSYLLGFAVFWSSLAVWLSSYRLSLLDRSVKAALLLLCFSFGSEVWAQELNSAPRVNIRQVPSVASRAALFFEMGWEMINTQTDTLSETSGASYKELAVIFRPR